MTTTLRPRRLAALACAVLAALAAGCGSAAPPARPQSLPAAAAISLTTSLATADGTWAVVVMGNPASSQADAFWQLVTLAPGSTQWALVTPPGVADNGGIVAAADTSATRMLRVAFRPSQNLTFSPLASTSNSGRTWAPGLLGAGIAAVPDALAARGSTMLALLTNGTIDQTATGGTRWSTLSTARAITASAAGRRCTVTDVTAVSLTPSGVPLAGAACSIAGSPGIFAYSGGTWHATGPGFAGQPSRVLRLTTTPAGNSTLLMAGTGSKARLYAAWSSDGDSWALSPPLPAEGQIRASGTGTGGLVWVITGDGHATAISGPGGSWHALPQLPAGTAALAAVGGAPIDALAVAGKDLTVFRLAATAGEWTRTQVIQVPIQQGSSG